MPFQDYFILMSIGGVFLFLGLIALIWGKHEEQNYFNSLAARAGDAREFMEHWPHRPQPGGLKTGGWIAIILGFILLSIGIILWLLVKSSS